MKKITVYTPTYNRAYCLKKLYQSLVGQTCKDFNWLIIDDGSTDNTKDIVNRWINEGLINIDYIYQENQGMVAAHNTAHNHINTELNVCIDSDDFMPSDAIEKILTKWQLDKEKDIMGIIGLDSYKNGDTIGDKLPDIKSCTFSELKHKYKNKGDKKYVLRSDLIKSVLPYPYIEGEKFPAPSYLYLILEQSYKFLILNEVLCVVEYLPDGNSMNKLNQYKKSPNAFAIYRTARMKYAYDYKDRFRNAVHYVSSKLLAKRYNFIKESEYKFTTLLAIPLGALLCLYIRYTNKNAINENLNKQ